MIKFDKNIFLLAKSLIYLMGQKYLGYHYLVIYDKLLKHSHWVTQETYTVTQETKTRRYCGFHGQGKWSNDNESCTVVYLFLLSKWLKSDLQSIFMHNFA